MTAQTGRRRGSTGRRTSEPAPAPLDTTGPAVADLAAPSAPGPVPDTTESLLRSALSVLTALGPPLTVATALMFYFGWARSDVQARYMGLDLSLFGYSTQDYVLQSISTLYLPLLATALLILVWLGIHQRVERALTRRTSRPALRRAGQAAFGLGLVMAASTIVMSSVNRRWEPLVIPLVLAMSMAIAAYGEWLARAANDADHLLLRVPLWQRAMRALLVAVVITLALFWEVSNYAGVVGRGYALQIARSVPTLPRATIFSSTPLDIQAPGVREERIDADPGAGKETFRYRTTGLRFMTRSGGRMFLLHDGWSPQHGTVIVIPDNDQVRWQFST